MPAPAYSIAAAVFARCTPTSSSLPLYLYIYLYLYPPDVASSHERALRLLAARFMPQGEFKHASDFVGQ